MPEYDYVLENPYSQHARPVTCCLFTTISFVVASLFINFFITDKYWHPKIPMLTDRFQRYRENIDEIEVIAIGSSHVYYGFHEAAFDQATMQNDQPLNSFNFGVEALSMAERRSVVELICAETPPNLKCVLVEPETRMIANPNDILTRRTRYFITLSNVYELSATKWFSNRPLKKRIGAALIPIGSCLAHMANLGVGADILLPPTADSKELDLIETGNSEIIDHQWSGDKRFDNATVQVEQALENLSKPDAFKSRELCKSEFASNATDFKLLSRLGVPIGLIFPPTTKGFEEDSAIRSFAESEDYPWIISFTPDSEYWKQFADEDVWYDSTHLNEQGAKKMSLLLAIEVLAKLESAIKD